MKLNEATIKHYRSEMIPTSILKKKVSLNEAYLKEKPTWYEIDGKLQYFKIRNDFRLFTELFFSKFAATIMDLPTIEYNVAYVRTKRPSIPQSKEETKCGLLSVNFQTPESNHYLVSELMHSEISDFIAYGGYSLKNLLHFFKDYLISGDYSKNELFLIKLFISDAYTYHVDRNPNNISFKIPKIPGVSYKDRLHPEKIKKIPGGQKHTWYDYDNTRTVLKGLQPDVVFDSERILGVDHKNVRKFNEGDCWAPLFPYDFDTDFKGLTQEEINLIQEHDFFGLDPNLCSLYFDHTEICKPFFERLAYDDEYRKILEEFTKTSGAIQITPSDAEYVQYVLENRRKEFKKILEF